MNEIAIVQNVKCYEENGTAYLSLDDVARGLGFTQTKNGVTYIRWDTVFGYLNDFGFSQQVGKDGYIPENIFYRLAMKAKNETAERFQAKVADEIIPSIRKNGGYIANQEQMSEAELLAKALSVATRINEERQKQIEAIRHSNRLLEEEIEESKPKVLFADAVTTSKTSILVGELAKLLKQNGVKDMGQKRLFSWLREQGYLIKRGSDYNMPTQKSMELGLFEIKETVVTHASGYVTINKTTKVTGKGQQYFINKFLGGLANDI